MAFLLDTHAVLWGISNDANLSGLARSTMEDYSNTCFVSIAYLWEMSINGSTGKLELEKPMSEVFRIIESSSFEILPIKQSHLLRLQARPLHHRDPFDRLLIAQAIEEKFTVITKDKQFSLYPVNVLWA